MSSSARNDRHGNGGPLRTAAPTVIARQGIALTWLSVPQSPLPPPLGEVPSAHWAERASGGHRPPLRNADRPGVGAACGRPDWFFNEEKGANNMRLDKWLKVSRLIKRRTVANEACDNARVTANGRAVKASYDVKVGDVLELRFGERTVKVEVLVVADNVGKNDAAAMYQEVL